MATRRMISKEVVGSARFLKMPQTCQNMYFHLVINADDDGIVEAYPVISMIHGNPDDLNVLAGRGFIKVLNEDLVSYIIHWTQMNLIRADRKKDSVWTIRKSIDKSRKNGKEKSERNVVLDKRGVFIVQRGFNRRSGNVLCF